MGSIASLRIAILVLNYNGKKYLAGFLKEASFLRDEKEADLVIVDNASCDDSLAFLKAHYPWVRVVRNHANLGWGEGYNQAIRTLQEQGQKYSHYMFINNDVFPTKDWYDKMLAAARTAAADVGEIGCRAVFAKGFVVEDILNCDTKERHKIDFELLPANDNSVVKNRTESGRLYLGARVSPFVKKIAAGFAKHVPAEVRHASAWYSCRLRNGSADNVQLNLKPNLQVLSQVKLSTNTSLLVVTSKPAATATMIELQGKAQLFIIRVVNMETDCTELIQNSGIGLNGKLEGYDLHCFEPKDVRQDHASMRGVCGVCKMVSVAAFEAAGGFDQAYFMYYEDIDFSLHLQKLGYRFQLVEDAYLRHIHAGSSKAGSVFFWRQVAWSLLYFHYKHGGFFRRLTTYVAYQLRAMRERRREVHWMAKIHLLVTERFRREYGKNYIMGSKSQAPKS